MIIPRYGDIITHEQAMDVAFFVDSFKKYSSKYYTVKGTWLNQGYVNTRPLFLQRTKIKIKVEDMRKWMVCENPLAKCVRNESWIKLK